MMLAPNKLFCITYKSNQKSFDVHLQKYSHDFKVSINDQDFEGSIGLEVPSMNMFLVSNID